MEKGLTILYWSHPPEHEECPAGIIEDNGKFSAALFSAETNALDVDGNMIYRPNHITVLRKYPNPLNLYFTSRLARDDVGFRELPVGLLSVSAIVELIMPSVGLTHVPNEIIGLRHLEKLDISHNPVMKRISGAVGFLPALKHVDLLASLPGMAESALLRLKGRINYEVNNTLLWRIQKRISKRCNLIQVFAYEFAEVCFGLQDLGLPALVTLEILDALRPNAVRMAAKWDLIVAVKHFHR